MPICGSQVILCDMPIRFDTYTGCSHLCSYCFTTRSGFDNKNLGLGEGPVALRNFIEGKRVQRTAWADWSIPLHWGGMSDPFQPIERKHRRSEECLEIFAETQYPVIISTKGNLIEEDPWFSLLSKCNVAMQVSIVSPSFDKIEKGAPPFAKRLEIIAKLNKVVKRSVVRVQPYIPEALNDVLGMIPVLADAGVHGITIEGMKYWTKAPGLVKVGGDMCYPIDKLRKHFVRIRSACHRAGVAFYCAENRLRKMGDSVACCGVGDLDGFRGNSANLNHFLFDKENFLYTDAMKEPGSAGPFITLHQSAGKHKWLNEHSYEEAMDAYTRDKGALEAMGIGDDAV